MTVITEILVLLVFPLIAFVVTWKVYNYFLSLNDAVHLSYLQYFVKKFIASSIAGVISFFIGMAIFADGPALQAHFAANAAKSDHSSTPASGATNSDPVPESKTPASFDLRDPAYRPKPGQVVASQNTSTASCPPGVPTAVCKNPDLMPIRDSANAALMRANSRNQSDTAWIKNELIGRLNACGGDTSCIKSAYQQGIEEFNAVQSELR